MKTVRFISQTLRVWNMYLHLAEVYGKCRYINISYMEPLGKTESMQLSTTVWFLGHVLDHTSKFGEVF